jgi:hypothetical protein
MLRASVCWQMAASIFSNDVGADLVTTCLIVEEIAQRCPLTAIDLEP